MEGLIPAAVFLCCLIGACFLFHWLAEKYGVQRKAPDPNCPVCMGEGRFTWYTIDGEPMNDICPCTEEKENLNNSNNENNTN